MPEIEISIKELFDAISEFENHQFSTDIEYFQKELILIQDENDNWIEIDAMITKKDKKRKIFFDSQDCIEVADRHLMHISNGDCILANKIQKGDLIEKSDGTLIRVVSNILFDDIETMYDIQVNSKTHLYQTSNKIIHHNSFIAATLANYYADFDEQQLNGTIILVHQRILQEQYFDEDWHYIANHDKRIATVWSADNYDCPNFKHLGCTCQEVRKLAKKDTTLCPKNECCYIKDRENFINSPVSTTNIQFFLTYTTHSYNFAFKKLIIVDEAHSTEQSIMQFVTTDISEYIASNRLSLKVPRFKPEDNQSVLDWVKKSYLVAVSNKVSELESKVKNSNQDLRSIDQETKNEMSKTLDELDNWKGQKEKVEGLLKKFNPESWILDTSRTKTGYRIFSFKPIVVKDEVDKLLFNKADKILLMSATILDKSAFCESLGIDENQAEFFQMPCDFPASKRPVHFMPAGSMSFNNIDSSLPLMASTVDHLLNHHHSEKGIIHTHTYRIAEYIKNHISKKNQARVLVHSSDNRDEILEKHINSKKPTVLLTPSMSEGVDLKDDLSRFQMICKIPFPFLGDKRIKLKKQKQPHWYAFHTAKLIVQSLGRSVRNNQDYAVSYILDSDFERFYRMHSNLFPQWIKDAIIDF